MSELTVGSNINKTNLGRDFTELKFPGALYATGVGKDISGDNLPLTSTVPQTPIGESRLVTPIDFGEFGITEIPQTATLFVELAGESGLLWDFDGNIFITEQAIHDSPNPGQGRYATLLQEMSQGQYQPEHWSIHNFGSCLGMETSLDLKRLIPAASAAFPGVSWCDKEAMVRMAAVHNALLPLWLNQVEPVPGALDAIRRSESGGARSVICSAGPGAVVEGLLSHHRVRSVFVGLVTDTPKKTPDGYVGDAAYQACQLLGVNPAQAVLIGDTVSDVMTGAHAGVACVIIRLPGSDAEGRYELQKKYIAAIEEENRKAPRRLVGPDATKVIFLHHFDQLYFASSRDSDSAVNFQVLAYGQDSNDSRPATTTPAQITNMRHPPMRAGTEGLVIEEIDPSA